MRGNLETPRAPAPPVHGPDGPDAGLVPRLERWRAAHRIVGIYEEEVTMEIGGRPVTRRGSSADPAVLVEGRNGIRKLQLASELEVF